MELNNITLFNALRFGNVTAYKEEVRDSPDRNLQVVETIPDVVIRNKVDGRTVRVNSKKFNGDIKRDVYNNNTYDLKVFNGRYLVDMEQQYYLYLRGMLMDMRNTVEPIVFGSEVADFTFQFWEKLRKPSLAEMLFGSGGGDLEYTALNSSGSARIALNFTLDHSHVSNQDLVRDFDSFMRSKGKFMQGRGAEYRHRTITNVYPYFENVSVCLKITKNHHLGSFNTFFYIFEHGLKYSFILISNNNFYLYSIINNE
tara:strand:+ start:34 stop:801 length:768 start_codon:yes stop_codon:yes gene_type:complete